MQILQIYVCVINLIAFIMYGVDKWKAVHKRWRISEAVLMGIACAGGSAGALLGMYVFHHKTKQDYFSVGVPLIILMQVVVLFFLMNGKI